MRLARFLSASGVLAAAVTAAVTIPLVSSSSAAGFDFQAAYDAAAPGATVCIPAGNYPHTELVRDAGHDAGPAVTFKACDGHVQIDDLQFGTGAKDPANWVTFDGNGTEGTPGGNLDIPGGVYAYALSDHITLRNMSIGEGQFAVGGIVTFASPRNLLIEDDVIGPGCCGWDGGSQYGSPINIRLTIRSVGDPNPTNVTIRDNLLQGSVRFCSDWDTYYKAKYGPCPGPSTNDTDQTHNDVIHAYGCTNCVFDSNVIPVYDVQAIFLEEVNGGYEFSGQITNNYLGEDVEGAYHAIWPSFGCAANDQGDPTPTGGGHCGTWLIAFNTLTSSSKVGAQGSDTHGRFGTGTIKVIGNVGGWLVNGTDDCQGSSLTVTYAYNLWSKVQYGGCSPTDGSGDTDSWISSDGHLLSPSSPPNGYVKSAADCALVGRSAPCDAGAQAGGGGPTGPTGPSGPTGPTGPQGVQITTATLNTCNASSKTLTWAKVPGAAGYWLYRDGVKVSSTKTGLKARFSFPCGTHTLGVLAVDASGAAIGEMATRAAP